MSDPASRKTIDDVRRFWSSSPLFVGEGAASPGTREWFEEHERIYLQDCLAGEPSSIFTDNVPHDARVLDVGCGPGFWVRYFARHGFTRVKGCDLTVAAVELASRSLELFELSAHVDVGNAEELPYADASIDHVNCQGVLHHTPSPRKAVEEFARVLAPGGTVCLSVYYRNWLLRRPRTLRLVARVFGRFVGLRGRGREAILSSGDADEIVRMYDGFENPIGRAYTDEQVAQLVDGLFTVDRVERFYFPARALGINVPRPLHRWLSQRCGLMIVLRGRKRPAPFQRSTAAAPLVEPALRPDDRPARPKAHDSMNILGFSAWFHDSAACLIRDGQLVAFAEEERFSRRKHTPEFPRQSIDYCLAAGNLTLDEIDAAVFYVDPRTMFMNNIRYVLSQLPGSANLFRKGTTVVPVGERYSNLLRIKSVLCRTHGARGTFPLITLPHYRTHQGAAFLCSPFQEAAIVTMDVAVDGTTQTIALGRGNRIEDRLTHSLPHGWGMLYSLFTQLVGFKYYDEYKVMGMSAYGEPKYLDFIEDRLYRFDDATGAFSLNLDYFAFQHHGMRRIWSDRLLRELGPARDPAAPLDQRHYDLAASAQRATERFGIRMARLAKKLTGANNLTMAGGVVQNVLMNQAIATSGIFDRTFFQPLASDVGCPLGAALYYYHCTLERPREFEMRHLYWGPDYEAEYEATLVRNGLRFRWIDNPAPEIARAIADGAVVGFVAGRMEAGPRALGARSIMADPRRADMKETLNLRVKHREHFRPFAPSCLEERLADVFEPLPGCESTGYMVVTATVRNEWRARVPAITHQDGTARPQAVSRESHPLYWNVIREFEKLTGVPLVINTSFNDNEPIVCTPQDAVNCFLRTKIDLLVFEHYLVYREENRERTA